jgi:methionyl-tRNA formyltransferase
MIDSSNNKPSVLFMGTPEFCLPTLEALKNSKSLELKLVVTQPDAPRGRKLKLQASPVKSYALENDLKVISPDKVSDPSQIDQLKDYNFDLAIVLAYGQILKQELLDILPDRFINIHASLLPRWRGAAPIQRAIMEGDSETGLSFQLMRLKLDSGPVIFESKCPIKENEDSIELMHRLSNLSGDLVEKVCIDYLKGELKPQEQNPAMVTFARKIEKEEGLLDWHKPAKELHNQIRGLQWGPGAYTYFKSKRLKVSKTEVDLNQRAEPGLVLRLEDDAICVGTGEGVLKVSIIQPEGRPKMDVNAFVNGYGLTSGFSFLKS